MGRQADVPALADFRAVEGEDLPDEPPLAAAQSPAGLVVCTSTAIGLIRGGRWQKLFIGAQQASWATAATFGDATLVARLVTDATSGNVVLRCYRITPAPTAYGLTISGLDITTGATGDILMQLEATAEAVGVDHPVFRPTYDLRQTRTFLWGAFVDAQHLIYVQRVVLDEAGIDKLEVHVVWVEADTNLDATADTVTLSSSDMSSPPNSTYLRHRVCGGRLTGSDHVCVVLPHHWQSSSDALKIDIVSIDDELTASVASWAIKSFPTARTSNYTYPLRFLALGDGRGMAYIRETNVCGLIDGVALTITVLNSPFQGPVLEACPDPAGGALIFCRSSSGDILALHRLTALGVLSLRLTVPVDALSARQSGAMAADRHLALKGISDGKHYRLPDRVVQSAKATALYLPGLSLASRTPSWGPWSVRAIPAEMLGAMGADADGRVCLAALDTAVQTSTAQQSVALLVSGAP